MADLGLNVDAFVFSALAASEIALTETEKELGAVLVDIGAGTTSICAYVEGVLEFSAVIPVGAKYITQDIASGLRISLEDAEKLKLYLSSDEEVKLIPLPGESKAEFTKRKKKFDLLDPEKVGITNHDPISRKFVTDVVMEPRIKEIFTLVLEELAKAGLLDDAKLPAGIVVTGGGALTYNLIDVARYTTKMSVRLAKPSNILGLTDDIKQANFAVALGLLVYAKRQGNVGAAGGGGDFSLNLKKILPAEFLSGVTEKAKSWFKKIFP
jgi:cell division protein FtsA